jgi:uncharacterized protein (DUF952 family)
MRIFHIVAPDDWARAEAVGTYRPPSVEAEGFVHFSFADQVAGTANLLYRERSELIVVELDPAQVDAELVVEDSYGGGTEFPHIYGAIPTSAKIAIYALERDENGDWAFTPGDPLAPGDAGVSASPDR